MTSTVAVESSCLTPSPLARAEMLYVMVNCSVHSATVSSVILTVNGAENWSLAEKVTGSALPSKSESSKKKN